MDSTYISKDRFYKESEMEPYATWKVLSLLVIGIFVVGVLWTRQMRNRQGHLADASRRRLTTAQEADRQEQLQSQADGDLQQQ
jgi:hypothetical protein